jgi:hypothetical protein
MLTENKEIEIVFDETNHTYHAFWRPPLTIGAGSSVQEAVADMREALQFSMQVAVSEIAGNSPDEGISEEVHNDGQEQTAVYACLPHSNCGKCGFVNCWGFAEALVKGEADLLICRKLHSEQIEKIKVLLPAQSVAKDAPPLTPKRHRERRQRNHSKAE